MKTARLIYGTLIASSIAVLLAGCSGGGGDGASPTAPPAGPSVVQIEFDSYSMVNQARKQNGVQPPLEHDEVVAGVAREHSRRMRDLNFFAHHDPQGRDVGKRLNEAGISFRSAGENLARIDSSSDPAAWAHDHMMASPTHRQTILDPRFVVVGTGVATDGQSYWLTQIFVEP